MVCFEWALMGFWRQLKTCLHSLSLSPSGILIGLLLLVWRCFRNGLCPVSMMQAHLSKSFKSGKTGQKICKKSINREAAWRGEFWAPGYKLVTATGVFIVLKCDHLSKPPKMGVKNLLTALHSNHVLPFRKHTQAVSLGLGRSPLDLLSRVKTTHNSWMQSSKERLQAHKTCEAEV